MPDFSLMAEALPKNTADVAGYFWLRESNVLDLATQVAEWTLIYPDAPCVVIGRERTAHLAPPAATFRSVESILKGHLHPQAVRPDDEFAVCRTVIGASSTETVALGVFFRPGLYLSGPLTDLVARAASSDAVICFQRRPMGSTNRFAYAESSVERGSFLDDVIALRFAAPVAKLVYDNVIGSCASTIARPMWAVAIEVLIALQYEGDGRVASSPDTIVDWSSYCRAKDGDDVDFNAVCVRTNEVNQYVEAPENQKRRMVDHDDFYVGHRVHSIAAIADHLALRALLGTEVPPSVKFPLRDRRETTLADIRRNIDPFASRWTAPDGLDFTAWLSEQSSAGVTRFSEMVMFAHPDLAPRSMEELADPSRLQRWAQSLQAGRMGINPQSPSLVLREVATSNGPTHQPSSYLGTRLSMRKTAVTPHLRTIRAQSRAAAIILAPYPLRKFAVQRRSGKSHDNMKAAGRFGSRPLEGLNVIGPYRNLSGLSVAMKASLAALNRLGVPFDIWDTSDFLPTKTTPPDVPLRYQSPGDVTLLHLNINEVLPKLSADLRYGIGGRYNIAYWFWETITMPPEYERACGLLREAWCATQFIAEIMERRSVKSQVVGLPYTLPLETEVVLNDEMQRTDVFKICFAFDCYSSIERKNPMGLIDAFTKAFGRRTDVRLILKAGNLLKFPRFRAHLMSIAQGNGNISIYEQSMDRRALNGLIAGSDLYVSLHRSEGVGLTLLEAMALGTPCMATNYSGNVDFMDSTNSVLVPGAMETTYEQHGPYPPGTVWCKPDGDFAVDALRSAAAGSVDFAMKIVRAKQAAAEFCDPERYISHVSTGFRRLEVLG